MNAVLNVFAYIIVLGFWLGAAYFLFGYSETTVKMQLGIQCMLCLVLGMNILFCVGIKFVTKGLLTLKWYNYVLILFFGYFGCSSIKKAIQESYKESKAKINSQVNEQNTSGS